MPYLIIVSIIWAFSFGLIKNSLAGLDSGFVSFARIAISFIFFLPFLKYKNIDAKLARKLLITGAIQYGLMYIFYISAFKYIASYQAALFTVFTPIYVTLSNGYFTKKILARHIISALLAAFGCAVLVYRTGDYASALIGFVLMQFSNISFAFGQIYYCKLMKEYEKTSDHSIFAILFFGAFLLTGIWGLISGSFTNINISATQIYSLLYLGAIASGLCFFLWNLGARKVGAGTLSAMNNLKIPLATLISISFFGESANLLSLSIALASVLGSAYLANAKNN